MKEKVTNTFVKIEYIRNMNKETGSKGEKHKNDT
jgi:hypothetical protein